jgi:peptide/nickel transport system permease protein
LLIRFAARRLVIIPIALLLVHFLGFSYAHIAGPIRAARTPYVFVQPHSPPLLPTYQSYLRQAAHLDFGTLPGTQEPIVHAIGKAAVASLGLLTLSLVISVLAGLFLGFQAVRTDPPRISQWLTVTSTVGLAMPSFYIGTLFVVASISYVLGKGPGSETPFPIRGFGWDSHLVLPTLALVVRPTVQIARVTSSLLAEEMGKQYILAARSFGHTWRAVRVRHALSNILAPIVLSVAGSFRLLASELILIEWLFQWPGLGRLLGWTLVPPLLSSSEGSPLFLNPPVVAAVLVVFGALFLLTDSVAGILVKAVDPRLRAAEEVRHHG